LPHPPDAIREQQVVEVLGKHTIDLREGPPSHDFFISYSRADRDVVVALSEGLEARGKRAWVDLEDIPPSAEWMAEIRAAIDASGAYVVVVSPSSTLLSARSVVLWLERCFQES